jgi:hypothetical protein
VRNFETLAMADWVAAVKPLGWPFAAVIASPPANVAAGAVALPIPPA